MNKKTKKIKVGAFAVTMLFLTMTAATTVSAESDGVIYTYAHPSVPPGPLDIQWNISINVLDPNEYGTYNVTENGFSDGFQVRQTFAYINPYFQTRNNHESLVGQIENVLFYVGILPQTHRANFDGTITWVLTDECAEEFNITEVVWDWHTIWGITSPPGISYPWVSVFNFTWYCTNAEFKKVIYDCDYSEDGIFVRHIYRVFRDWSYYPHEHQCEQIQQVIKDIIVGRCSI